MDIEPLSVRVLPCTASAECIAPFIMISFCDFLLRHEVCEYYQSPSKTHSKGVRERRSAMGPNHQHLHKSLVALLLHGTRTRCRIGKMYPTQYCLKYNLLPHAALKCLSLKQ